MTWLSTDRFYTFTTLAQDGLDLIVAELGANDPKFNLRREQALILRASKAKNYSFVSVLEPHGEYNGPAELTTQSNGSIKGLKRFYEDGADIIRITADSGDEHYLALSYDPRADETHKVNVDGRLFEWQGYYGLFDEHGERK
jgi:hypothetical protein